MWGVKSNCNVPLCLTSRQGSERLYCLLQHPGGLLRVEQVCEGVLSTDEVFQPVAPYSVKRLASGSTHSSIESSLAVKAIAWKMYSADLPRDVASRDNGADTGEKNSWTISHRSRNEAGFPCSSGVNSGAVKEGRNRARVARTSSRPESATIYRKALGSIVAPCQHTHRLASEESFTNRQKANTQGLQCAKNIHRSRH